MAKRKKYTLSSWRQRRVAFIVSDASHTVKPVSAWMPVRVKERTGIKTIFEGPISARWAEIERQLGNTEFDQRYDLVGVLYANDEQLEFGRIDWLVQSEIVSVEAGADRISQPEIEETDHVA